MQQVKLVRRTTWRCGKVEKAIVKALLRKNNQHIESISTNIKEHGRDEVIDAIKRLQKRSIVTVEEGEKSEQRTSFQTNYRSFRLAINGKT